MIFLIAIKIVIGEALNRKQSAIRTSGGEIPPTTESDELSLSIQSSINLLFRLSMLIRQQKPRGRLPMPDGSLRHDPDQDIRHIKDKFRKTKDTPWLAERLGRFISERQDFYIL